VSSSDELSGHVSQSDHLFVALYHELHRLADAQLRRGGRDLTLSPTTLLHEAWLDISARDALRFPDRARFLGYAARAMRRIVIDYARHSHAQKRGGGAIRVTIPSDLPAGISHGASAEELSRLSDAMDELATIDPLLAELVDLRFFCGYTFAEIAHTRGVSERTVHRDWRQARLLLYHTLLAEPAAPTAQRPVRADGDG
jgi:RNA polymerase sigma factor (TIGR02999 family)